MAYGILVILALVYLALLLMLVSKIVEGLLRLFFGVSFDRSKHSSDTGLLGVLGLLGCSCCGGRRRGGHRRKRNSGKRADGSGRPHMSSSALGGMSQMDRESDISSYMPPAGGAGGMGGHHADDGTSTPPRFLHAESRKGSTYSQPPSVLRPEHANRPYREAGPVGEEGEGYIMGAWQPFPRASVGSGTAYSPLVGEVTSAGTGGAGLGIAAAAFRHGSSPVPDGPPAGAQKAAMVGGPAAAVVPQAAPSPSGFARVGGGRAHIDTPYAIATGSTQTFPSLGQQSVHSQSQPQPQPQSTRVHTQSFGASVASVTTMTPTLTTAGMRTAASALVYDDTEPAMSFSSVDAGVGSNGLPPGAMMPAHIRTKSQTAIVEDFHPLPAPASDGGAASSSTSGSRLSMPQVQQQQQQQQQQPPSAWDLQARPAGVRQTHVSENSYLRAPPHFTLGGGAENEDESGDEQGALQKKKARPWYHIGRGRAHSSEGRTSTSAAAAQGLGAGPGATSVDAEMGGLGAAPQPQRSFVVIRKPPGSMGRLNQAASGSSDAPKTMTRPPTR